MTPVKASPWSSTAQHCRHRPCLSATPGPDPGGLHHLVIQVESMDEIVSALAARGAYVEPPSSPDGSEDFWIAWVTDPDGYRIELVQRPTGHPRA
jgi:lactoylglutathione lyase